MQLKYIKNMYMYVFIYTHMNVSKETGVHTNTFTVTILHGGFKEIICLRQGLAT